MSERNSSKTSRFIIRGSTLEVIKFNKLISKNIILLICRNFNLEHQKFIDKHSTVEDFLLYLVAKKKYVFVKFRKNSYYSPNKAKYKKQLYVFKDYLILGQKQICELCKKSYIHCHTCRGDFCYQVSYMKVKPAEYQEYSMIVDIVLDIECIQVNEKHIPVLICIAYKKKDNSLKEKTFYTIKKFFKWLHAFSEKKCKFNSRINLIGFNSSRYDFVFFIQETREYVLKDWSFKKIDYNYIQKQGAIIYNTYTTPKSSIWFIDILRYAGGVTSLRQMAQDLQVPTQKSAFPFQILTLETYEKDCDGFPSQIYFDKFELYFDAKCLWISHQKPEILKFFEIYCQYDVRATLEIYYKQMEMFEKYIPWMQGKHMTFFHGTPSMTYNISLDMALDSENLKSLKVWKYSGRIQKITLYAPLKKSHKLWEDSMYGGWVGCHMQGKIDFDVGMVDIVSHYPTSFTCYYGIGKPREMTAEECVHFTNFICSYDRETLPIFVAKVSVNPPPVITDFASPLPQRCRGTLTWSYLSCKQTLNSIDIWNCSKFYGFKFEIIEGEIFTKKAILFQKFVETFAKMKDDGKREKNELKTKCGKIGLNSGIGKYGEKKERTISKILKDDEDLRKLDLLLANNSEYCWHELLDIIPHEDHDEAIIKEYNTTINKKPNHIWSCMLAYSRDIRCHLIRLCRKHRNLSIWSSRLSIPCPIYGDTDSIVITREQLRYLKKNSPSLFDPSVGFYDPEKKDFNFHIQIEDLFNGSRIPSTKCCMIIGLKAYMIQTNLGGKYKCKGHRIAKIDESCECGSGDKKWFCTTCFEKNRDKEININGVTLQHFYNAISGQTNSFEYLRFLKNLNRPIGQGKEPFSIYTRNIRINLNYKELSHKYVCINNICYPFTDLDK